jgi:predicted phage tail protein
MLAKNPQTKPNDTASYLFNGPVNTTEQGNPVPVLYGRLIVGSQVVSASVCAYDLAIAPNPTATPNQVTWKGQV